MSEVEFLTSRAEIRRRKIGYISLVASLFISSLLLAIPFGIPSPPVIWILLALPFVLLGAISFQSFRALARLRIRISDQTIEFVASNRSIVYPLADIQAIRIKRRSNGIIREIALTLHPRKRILINACEDCFELLKDRLVGQAGLNIRISEVHEPIDFDHPFFYPSLGVLLGLFFVALLKIGLSMRR